MSKDGSTVIFGSSFGVHEARWSGAAAAVEGHDYDVEIDVADEPTWGLGLRLAGDEAAADGIVGQIEVYDEAGLALRLGRDGLLLLDPQGEAPIGADEGAAVILLGTRLILTPVNC